MQQIIPISGYTSSEYDELRDIFARAIAAQGGGGAALSIYKEGRLVTDLVGGDYSEHSLQYLFSVAKAISAVAAAVLHDDGVLDLDQPLNEYWSEFDNPLATKITARHVLSHQAGLPALREPLTLAELLHHKDEVAICSERPVWEPGSKHGYHGFTFGTLLNGIFRALTGMTVSEFLLERITSKFGLELWLGAPKEIHDRVETVTQTPVRWPYMQFMTEAQSAVADRRGYTPMSLQTLAREKPFNDEDVWQGDWPAVNAFSNSKSLAKLLNLFEAGQIVGEDTKRSFLKIHSQGYDQTLGVTSCFGLGFQRAFPVFPMLGEQSYGHEGAGGCAAFTDTKHGISIAWTTNMYPALNGASPAFLSILPSIALAAS